ncbi:hypothetical protein NLI96_g13106 [Meripilus lineatus]|uniref:Uncharacterized protein n=1 Tax=Meripilus lineatus TaxID=2056292 RepID=A0AAD5Y7L0_9APHY|nr:hypothetical protein NLI96_g13106 [Physisporinus lineatus]
MYHVESSNATGKRIAEENELYKSDCLKNSYWQNDRPYASLTEFDRRASDPLSVVIDYHYVDRTLNQVIDKECSYVHSELDGGTTTLYLKHSNGGSWTSEPSTKEPVAQFIVASTDAFPSTASPTKAQSSNAHALGSSTSGTAPDVTAEANTDKLATRTVPVPASTPDSVNASASTTEEVFSAGTMAGKISSFGTSADGSRLDAGSVERDGLRIEKVQNAALRSLLSSGKIVKDRQGRDIMNTTLKLLGGVSVEHAHHYLLAEKCNQGDCGKGALFHFLSVSSSGMVTASGPFMPDEEATVDFRNGTINVTANGQTAYFGRDEAMLIPNEMKAW